MAQQPATRIDAHFIAAGKYHDIDSPRLEILKLLAEHPHIRTTVACDYSGLERLDACRFLNALIASRVSRATRAAASA